VRIAFQKLADSTGVGTNGRGVDGVPPIHDRGLRGSSSGVGGNGGISKRGPKQAVRALHGHSDALVVVVVVVVVVHIRVGNISLGHLSILFLFGTGVVVVVICIDTVIVAVIVAAIAIPFASAGFFLVRRWRGVHLVPVFLSEAP